MIDHDGKFPKFKKSCPELAYNAGQALSMGHEALYITERCVMERRPDGLVLTEIAPGDKILQKDILDQMELTPIIPEGGPKLMPEEIFREEWGKLKEYMTTGSEAISNDALPAA